jgi:hypothetical protein
VIEFDKIPCEHYFYLPFGRKRYNASLKNNHCETFEKCTIFFVHTPYCPLSPNQENVQVYTVNRYWEYTLDHENPNLSLDDAAGRFIELLEDAVRS